MVTEYTPVKSIPFRNSMHPMQTFGLCCCCMMSICSSSVVCTLCIVDALFEIVKVNVVYFDNLKIKK